MWHFVWLETFLQLYIYSSSSTRVNLFTSVWFIFIYSLLFVCLYQQWGESAMLYEKGGYYDKAAAVYIRAKNWLVCTISLERRKDALNFICFKALLFLSLGPLVRVIKNISMRYIHYLFFKIVRKGAN